MSKIKAKFERMFEKQSRLIYRNPLKTLLVAFLLMSPLFYNLPKLSFDTSTKNMFRKEDPVIKKVNEFRAQFKSTAAILVAVQPPEVFTIEFFHKLKRFQEDLKKEVPYISDVNSLINVRYTYTEGDTIISKDLFDGWPEKEVDPAVIKERVMKNPFYIDNIISQDGKVAAIILQVQAFVNEKRNDDEDDELMTGFDTDTSSNSKKEGGTKLFNLTPKKNHEIVRGIQRVLARYEGPDFFVALAGGPILADAYNLVARNEMFRCMFIGSILVMAILAFLFRRTSGVVFPMLDVWLAIVCTLGFMAIFKDPVTDMTLMIPVFLVTCGVEDSMHIMGLFFQRIDKYGASKEDAAVYSYGHSGVAIILTSLTTAAGLLSTGTADLTDFVDMGIYSTVGVVMSLLNTQILFPALMAIFPIKPNPGHSKEKHSIIIDNFLQFVTDFTTRYSKRIILVSICLFAISAFFIGTLKFSHSQLDFLPKKFNVKRDITFIDKAFKGITTLEVIVDTKRENGVQDPEILNRIEQLSQDILKINYIPTGKVFSINDIIKEINKALYGNDDAFYKVPQDRRAIAQELLLFETSQKGSDLSGLTDSIYSKTRVTIKTPDVDAVVFGKFVADVEKRFNDSFQGKAEITVTGGMAILARIIPVALHSMAFSYLYSFVSVSILMILLVGSFKLGLISMYPNLLPIMLTLGIMGLFGVHLTLTTLMMGNIVLGLVVDNTIHFMYNFQRSYGITGDRYKAVQITLATAGRAGLFTSLVLTVGFFVLLTASLKHIYMFGFWTGITIIIGLLANTFLTPAIMYFIARPKKSAT